MRRRPDYQIGGKVDPYLNRWHLLPRNNWFNIYLHQMLRSDDDRALHDHPYFNISVPLRVGYREVMFRERPREGRPLPMTYAKRRRPFRPIFRRGATAHMLVKIGEDPAWSLFVTFRRSREWGFWCPMGRWVHWRAFTTGDKGESIGLGCG